MGEPNGELRVPIASDVDVVAARKAGRTLGAELGLNTADVTLLVTAISEVARNILVYATRGEILIRQVSRDGRRGLEVIARDDGPGIADVERALQDGYTTGKGLGLGLPGARRMVDEFQLQSAPGKGTTITMIKWAVRAR